MYMYMYLFAMVLGSVRAMKILGVDPLHGEHFEHYQVVRFLCCSVAMSSTFTQSAASPSGRSPVITNTSFLNLIIIQRGILQGGQ